jgi:glycerophosphoryl diester phosphodiesterase
VSGAVTVGPASGGSVWLERRVIAYAHQGGAWESPSSTLHAIRHALDAGAAAIELDVHATADGELVVCHDATVDRTTDRTGTIASFTLEELRRMDFSYWWIPGADVTPGHPPDDYPFRGRAPGDPAFGIATLREVLEQFPGAVLNLDIKQTAPVVAPYEAALARMLGEYGRRDDVIVASFLDAATDAFRGHAPGVPTSAGTITTAEAWRAVQAGEPMPPTPTVAYQVPERQGDLLVVDDRFVSAAHAAGKAVHVWTVNDSESMERLIDLGVDGIISDLPTTLCEVLGERSAAWVGR